MGYISPALKNINSECQSQTQYRWMIDNEDTNIFQTTALHGVCINYLNWICNENWIRCYLLLSISYFIYFQLVIYNLLKKLVAITFMILTSIYLFMFKLAEKFVMWFFIWFVPKTKLCWPYWLYYPIYICISILSIRYPLHTVLYLVPIM